MADQDSRSSCWTSLPGVLTGITAAIGAISGLTIGQHNKPNPANPDHKRIVESAGRTDVKGDGSGVRSNLGNEKQGEEQIAGNAASSGASVGTREWCAEKYK